MLIMLVRDIGEGKELVFFSEVLLLILEMFLSVELNMFQLPAHDGLNLCSVR